MRLADGDLFYHLNDPTGTSLVLVDGNGDETGRMVYDGFGMAMTNTLPITLTGALAGHPDAATGLVHVGGGRWYDPALGRPLQPNPMGGPPTLPQALNRYAATAVGQPGVYEAAQGDVFNWTPHAVGFAKNTAVELAKETAQTATKRIVTGYSYQATARIWVDLGESTFPSHVEGIVRARRGVRATRGTIWVNIEGVDLHQSADNFVEGLRRSFPDAESIFYRGIIPGSIKKLNIYDVVDDVAHYKMLSGLGIATDFGLGAAFQYLGDFQNPYLTRQQKILRFSVAGVSEAIGAGVLGIACIGSQGLLCPVVAGVLGGYIGSQVSNTFAFPWLGLEANRNLRPLRLP